MRYALLAVAALTLAACGDDTTDVNGSSVVGTYTLASINGKALPTTNSDNQTISSGSLVLRADLTFTYTETASGVGSHTTEGTYVVSGSSITFDPTDPEDDGAAGTISGTTLTIVASGEGTLVLNKTS